MTVKYITVKGPDRLARSPADTLRTEGPANGSVKVTTAGGTATLDVTFTTP